jgi:hypothetical protein
LTLRIQQVGGGATLSPNVSGTTATGTGWSVMLNLTTGNIILILNVFMFVELSPVIVLDVPI